MYVCMEEMGNEEAEEELYEEEFERLGGSGKRKKTSLKESKKRLSGIDMRGSSG